MLSSDSRFFIFGVSESSRFSYKKNIGINIKKQAKRLKKGYVKSYESFFNKTLKNSELRDSIKDNINFLKEIRSYRGFRHHLNLPCRGQRTHTNASKKKNKKKFS